MFEALGRFSYRFRWLVIGLWVVLFGVSVVATPWLANVLQGSFSNPDSPSQQAAAVIEREFSQGQTNLLVLFESDTLQATDPAFQQAQDAALAGLTAAGISDLESIQTYSSTGNELFLAKDGKGSVAVLSFGVPMQSVQQQVDRIRDALRDTGLRTFVTGEPAVNADLTSFSFEDLRRVELYALPVALVALIFVFGSLVSAALPVVTGGLAVTVTLGGMYLIAHLTTMNIFAMNTATLLGLAVAIDYALFIVSRFREELHRGASVREAVVVTSARAGRSIFYSGLAVIVGVVGLVFFPSPGLRSLAIGGVLVVFFSVAASLTFMPALMGVLGHRVNSVSVIKLHAAHDSRLWRRWAALLLKRPWASIVVALVLIGVVAGPAVGLKMQMTSASTLPGAAESRQGLAVLEQNYDLNALSPVSVLLTWEGDGDIDVLRAAGLFTYGQQLTGLPGVASVQNPFTLMTGMGDMAAMAELWPQFEGLLNDPDGFQVPAGGISIGGQTISAAQLEQFKQLVKATIADGAVVYRVVPETASTSTETRELVDTIQENGPPAGYELGIAGEAASSNDFFEELNTYFPWVIAWVVVTSFLVFVVLLRSLLLPFVAVVVNLLTIAMSYGWLVMIFQSDLFEGLLRFTSTGAIDSVIPVVLLCILFGITMDYAVFMLTRMHERWVRSGDNREAVTVGLVRTGRIILSAALLVVIVTGAFMFTSIAQTKMLGLGIALAIIVDVLFIRITLLPAVMTYFGRANWWWPLRATGRPGGPDAAAGEADPKSKRPSEGRVAGRPAPHVARLRPHGSRGD